MGDVPNYEANTATLYHMEKCDIIGTVKRTPDQYDLISVIILRINDKIDPEDDVLRLLQVICSNLIKKNQKLELLRHQGIRLDDELKGGIIRMCNISDLIEERGEARCQKNMAFEMLRDHMPHEKIAKYAKVPIETVKQWEMELLSAVQ